MTKTKWWLLIVGGFYLLLAVMSLWLFVNPHVFDTMFPFAADKILVRAFVDAWLIFVLDLAVLGGMMLFASRGPDRYRILVVTVALMELIRGAGGDLIWMLRGWPLSTYIPFMIVHLIIAATGLWFARQDSAQVSKA